MVLLRSCCCWQSVRSGSLASGIYTMTFYSVIVTAGSFHVHTIIGLPEPVPVLLIFSILMLAFAALSVMTSVVLIVGLCTNNRMMLVPWIVCITMTTILDVILSFYLLSDSEIDPFFGILVATDYFICALNVYCILCVTSQYQEYASGGNRPRQANPEGPPAIHFEAASSIRPNQSPARMVSVSIIQNNGSPTSSICRPLLPPGGSSINRAALSSNLNTSSSPLLMLSRSSFSSTSEISFYSSDLLSSSRRSSALPSQDVPKQGLSPVGEVNSFPSPSAETSIAVRENETEEIGRINTELCEIAEVNVEEDDNICKPTNDNSEEREKFEDTKTPTTSKFRVSGAFSSMKMSNVTKIEIPELPEGTELPSENLQSSTRKETDL